MLGNDERITRDIEYIMRIYKNKLTSHPRGDISNKKIEGLLLEQLELLGQNLLNYYWKVINGKK